MASKLFPQVEAQRIVDFVHGKLRRAIVRHELEPGFHLSVPALAVQFGVSRSPVREAVQRLVLEGLAVEQPRKGVYVTRYELSELLPLYQVRRVLEGLAAGLAAQHMTPQHINRIRRILEADRRAIEKDDLEGHIDSDIQFHLALMDCAGNPVLSEHLRKIYDRIHSAMTARIVPTGPQQAYRDHCRIFEIAQTGDVDGAEAAARDHVQRVLGSLKNC